MKYKFFYESFGKHVRVIEADNFRAARNKFFELTKSLFCCRIDAIHEFDDQDNFIRVIKF